MPAQFELYRDALGKHRWRLLSNTGRVVARGGESYESRVAALKRAHHARHVVVVRRRGQRLSGFQGGGEMRVCHPINATGRPPPAS